MKMLTKAQIEEMHKEANKSPSLTSFQKLQGNLEDALAHIAWQDKAIDQATTHTTINPIRKDEYLMDGPKQISQSGSPELFAYLGMRSVKPTSEEVG